MPAELFHKPSNVTVKKKGKLTKRRYMGLNSHLSKLKSCRTAIKLLSIAYQIIFAAQKKTCANFGLLNILRIYLIK